MPHLGKHSAARSDKVPCARFTTSPRVRKTSLRTHEDRAKAHGIHHRLADAAHLNATRPLAPTSWVSKLVCSRSPPWVSKLVCSPLRFGDAASGQAQRRMRGPGGRLSRTGAARRTSSAAPAPSLAEAAPHPALARAPAAARVPAHTAARSPAARTQDPNPAASP